MNRSHKIFAIIAMLAFVGSLLLTSFKIAIYGDSTYSFYKKEYEKYQVTESLHMEMDDVMDVTEKMMDYLIGKRPELSVITQVDGETKDFFNDQDRFHMSEVKDLFLGGLKLRKLLLAIAILFSTLVSSLIYRMNASDDSGDDTDTKPADTKGKETGQKAALAQAARFLSVAYFKALAIFGVASIVIGGLFASNFNKYFTIFHEIFFDNDLWMFDPATDYMIRMLTEGFFYDFVFRIGKIFFICLAICAVIAGVILVLTKAGSKASNMV